MERDTTKENNGQEGSASADFHNGVRVLKRFGKGRVGILEGIGTARLSKRKALSPRDKIIGDLKALGMNNRQVSEAIHGREHTQGKANYIGLVAKEPIVREHMAKGHEELISEAKERLMEAIPQATTNIITAIDGGDVSASFKVLGSVGVISGATQKSEVDINVSFGDWLISQRRVVDINAENATPRRVTVSDPDAIEMEVEGVRLTTSEED